MLCNSPRENADYQVRVYCYYSGFFKKSGRGIPQTSGNLDSGGSRNKTESWIFLVSSERMLRDDASAMFSHNSVERQGARCEKCPASTSPFPSL